MESEIKKVYEKKYRRDGVEVPIHCILMEVKNPKKHDPQTLHYHEYIEILYSLNSKAYVYINDRVIDFNTGDLVIVNSGEAHALSFEKDSSYIVIKVMPELIYTSEQTVFEMKYILPFIIQNTKNKRYFTSEELQDGYVRHAVTNVYREWETKGYCYEMAMRADILKIFLWVLRYWREHDLDAVDRFDYPDDLLKVIQSALEYIEKNYAYITEEEVAKHCNLSYSYFSRTFKKVMNQSFSEYIKDYRITKAEQMLLSTDYSISEISALTGFSTPSYFIQQFKSKKEVSPKQYRLKYL